MTYDNEGRDSEACRQASETAALRVLPWAVGLLVALALWSLLWKALTL